MPSDREIQTVQGKIARYVQKGEPVPIGLAGALAGYLATRQKHYLRQLANRRKRAQRSAFGP